MDPYGKQSSLTLGSYTLAGLLGFVALLFTLDALGDGLGLSVLYIGPVMAAPAILLALLVWQVTTHERVHLVELLITALTALGQGLTGLTLVLMFVVGEAAFLGGAYGLIGLAVALPLGYYTFIAARDRNRSLQGTA